MPKNICEKHQVERFGYSGACPECRKERALKAVMDYCGPDIESGGIDLGTGIYDLVADLLHLAAANDVEPDYIVHMAQNHYQAEVEDEVAEAMEKGVVS
ncbi:MAG: hypothetical protein ACLQED_13885 [Desulfobaccales bacterium]|jgi:hypothetical protein